MKYDRVLHLSDHPRLERLYDEWHDLTRTYGRGTWAALFKTRKYKESDAMFQEIKDDFSATLRDIVGTDVHFQLIESYEPRDRSGYRLGKKKMLVLYYYNDKN